MGTPLRYTLGLIKEFRAERSINIELENLLMCTEASEGRRPDPLAYEGLTVMQKVDIFEHVMDKTRGHDLQRVFWLKSQMRRYGTIVESSIQRHSQLCQ